MEFERFLTRVDEEIVERIVGKSAIQILNTLDTDLTRISKLQTTLLNIYSPIELLSNKGIRNDFIDILKPAEAEELIGRLGRKTTSNAFEYLKSIKFSSHEEFNALLNFFELEKPIQEPDLVLIKEKVVKPQYGLFKHQRKAIAEITDKLYLDNKKVLLHMPTGAGKTRTAMNIICNHFRSHEPCTVVWLAHTEELCEQAAQEFENAWTQLGSRELSVYRYWGASNSEIDKIKDGFIVGGLAKIYNLLQRNSKAISAIANNCSLVVMDEAHMAIAPTFKLNLSILISFNASLLGLSATPGRTYNDPNIDLELSQFFNKRKVTLKIDGYDNPVDFLIEKGYLARINNQPLLYQSGFDLSESDEKYLKDNLKLSDGFLKRISEDQKRNILIIQKTEELVNRHKRIILFALNVEHSNLLATCLQARGIKAFSITGNTEPTQRKRLIELFKSDTDSTIVLCNYGILTTGFDAPKTSCAVISRPTDSLVLYSQMVGRAIRGPLAGGNNEAEIVTVIDTCLPGFDKVATAFFNWEDVWE